MESKRYSVEFYDSFDREWCIACFNYLECLFDDLEEAKKLCDIKNKELSDGNKECGEYYGVIDNYLEYPIVVYGYRG